MAYIPERRRMSMKTWASIAARHIRPDPRKVTDLDAARWIVTQAIGGVDLIGPKPFEAVSAALLALHQNPAEPAKLYAWKPDRRASKACIRHFIEKAVADKAWAHALDPAWFERASDMSIDAAREYVAHSIHRLARKALEYKRMRAFLSVGASEAGSYAPVGWPMDRAARQEWLALNPQHAPQLAPETTKEAA